MNKHSILGATLGIILAGITAAATPASADSPQGDAPATTIWLERAQKGEAKAQTALGFLYMMGLRVERNDAEAARWFDAAAAQGDPDAQYYLGTLHLAGRGKALDPAAAHFWCELAIASGVKDFLQPAYSCAEQAARSMNREQVTTTRLRVSQWQVIAPAAR